MADKSLPLFHLRNFTSYRQPMLGMCGACKQVFRKKNSAQQYCSRDCANDAQRADVAARFWSHVEHTETCWLWQGRIDKYGYGTFAWRDHGRRTFCGAHRFAYIWHYGAIPEGLTVDHLCRVRRCVNPAHLEAVTCWENTRRGDTITGKNARKTHCVHGHPFDAVNTYVYEATGERQCRACQSVKERTRKVRKRLFAKG